MYVRSFTSALSVLCLMFGSGCSSYAPTSDPPSTVDGGALDGGVDVVAVDGGVAGDSSSASADTGSASDTGGAAVDTSTRADTTTLDAGGGPVGSALVDPSCVDGKFTETLPTGTEAIADLIQGYQPSGYMTFIEEALSRRYPFGKTLVTGAVKSAPQHCVDTFLPTSFRNSASQVLSRMGVIVHECGHFFDLYKPGKSFGASHYQITEAVAFTCTGASYQGSKKTFARSLIKGDKWAAANKPCNQFGEKGCDTYAAIYLNGDPKDAKFDSGDQGFNMLFEEVVQYVNSLAEAHAFADQIVGATSARDGILTFLWYLTRYLQMARLEYPDAYAVLSQDTCWREAILTVWGRAWLYLEATKGNPKLTIKGDKLLKNATEPDLVNEIALLRKLQGCP